MTTKSTTESGVQLVSRVVSKIRPSLVKLAPEIIAHNGPHPKEVIEISGPSNIGKSILLLEFIAKAIIPSEHGGHGAQVILLDLAAAFKSHNLARILEKYVLHYRMLKMNGADTEMLHDAIGDDVQSIVMASMQNLQIVNCFSSEDLERALPLVRDTVFSSNDIAMLAIESLGAHYWLDTSDDRRMRMSTYLDKWLKVMRKIGEDHGLVVAFTRPAFFPMRSDDEEKVDYAVKLAAVDEKSFNANAVAGRLVYEARYSIHNHGIRWEYGQQ